MTEPAAHISPDAKTSLREITEETLRSILGLAVRDDQKRYVADNAVSIAQCHFSKNAWIRAIYADDTPVGFLMLYDNPKEPQYYLWRFMIDARHQGKGFGKQAMLLLIVHVKRRPHASELLLSYVKGKAGPHEFYQSLGFVDTGQVEDGEHIMKLAF